MITDQGIRDAVIFVRDGKVSEVADFAEVPKSLPMKDYGHAVILPGLVDCHVHVNEPGRTEWEGFDSATQAAAAGGVTTIMDMPLNCVPPTTSLEALEEKLLHAQERLWIDCGFFGGLVPNNTEELRPMAEKGVFGFKCFLMESGMEEFPPMDEDALLDALPTLAKLKLPLLVHSEVAPEGESMIVGDRTKYETYLKSRPKTWENNAVSQMASWCREFRLPVHIVHLSSADAIQSIRHAKGLGLPLTVETCPHYLAVAAEEILKGATANKCAPPIREKKNQNNLWSGIVTGAIDFIASNHSPCTAEMKHLHSGDFLDAYSGISSLQLSLPVVWTAAKKRNISISEVVKWMARKPAEFLGLAHRKGSIAPGRDADLVILDPEERFTVDEKLLRHRHKVTPYLGKTLFGVVKKTYLRGEIIYEDGQMVGDPSGQALFRGSV